MPLPAASMRLPLLHWVTGSSVQSTFRSGMAPFLCHDHDAEVAGGCSHYDLDGLLRQGGPASGARSWRARPRILKTALRGNALLRAPAARSWRSPSRRVGGCSPAANSSCNRSTHGEAATRSGHAPSSTACCHGTSAGFATGRRCAGRYRRQFARNYPTGSGGCVGGLVRKPCRRAPLCQIARCPACTRPHIPAGTPFVLSRAQGPRSTRILSPWAISNLERLSIGMDRARRSL